MKCYENITHGFVLIFFSQPTFLPKDEGYYDNDRPALPMHFNGNIIFVHE